MAGAPMVPVAAASMSVSALLTVKVRSRPLWMQDTLALIERDGPAYEDHHLGVGTAQPQAVAFLDG